MNMTAIHPDIDFQRFAAEGRFMIQRSREDGRHVFYPRVLAPTTGHTDLEWVEAKGTGTVYSVTTVRPRPPEQPYNVSLVQLDEGPRLMTRVEGLPPEQVLIGLRVKARITREDDQSFIVFDPAGDCANLPSC